MKPDDAVTKGSLVLQTQMPLDNALYFFPAKTVEEFAEIFCCFETTLFKNNHFFPLFPSRARLASSRAPHEFY